MSSVIPLNFQLELLVILNLLKGLLTRKMKLFKQLLILELMGLLNIALILVETFQQVLILA